MSKIKRLNLTKNHIVKEINLKIGLSDSYINKIVDSLNVSNACAIILNQLINNNERNTRSL